VALTDNERGKKEKRNKRRSVVAETNMRWSDQQKLEAVSTWLALGNLALTSRLLSIPEITLRVWKAQEWWHEAVEEIRLQDKIQLSARMKKLVEASQTIVAQRLETGDPILNQKTGQIVYKPVSMKDAHKVAVDLMDRQHTLERITDEPTGTGDLGSEKLEKLAEKFAEMATKSIENQMNKRRTIDISVQDVEENDNAVDEEREEGLQTGVREISGETGTNRQPLEADNGTETS
jgi:hypothetical protein